MSDIVERAALAFIEAVRGSPSYVDATEGTDCVVLDGCFDVREGICAAIAAMREPSEGMQAAGHAVRNDPKTGMSTHCGTDEIYTAMIDAAIKGDKP